MIHQGTDEGVCKSCKRFKKDLYGSYCSACRQSYGRRTNNQTADSKDWHHKQSLEKAQYKRRVESDEIDTRSVPKGADEKTNLDYTISFVYLRRAVVDLLAEFDKIGYSESDAAKHYRQFGEYREPFKAVERLRKLLAQTD